MMGSTAVEWPGKATTMTSNVEMPIPMPDVPGADAGRGGLPDRSDLTLVQRAIVDSSAIADIGLRTAIASLVGVSMLPTVAAGIVRGSDMKRERKNLEFYAELASHHDPALSFPAPTKFPEVSATAGQRDRGVHRARQRPQHLVPEQLRAGQPGHAQQVETVEANNIVWAQHWRHADGPRPTLCVIHGFMGSSYLFNGLFFSLPWFYRSGYDVLLYTLPFHGRRAESSRRSAVTGYFAKGMTGFAERWPRPSTTSVPCWTICTTPASSASR